MVDEPSKPPENKRSARLAYYEGMRKAALEQFELTEQGLRKLDGVEPAQIEKLVADVHRRHEKLLKRIDRYIKQQTND